jgi:hypothetical protein
MDNKMEKIRNIVIETLKQNPQGLSPKEIFEKLDCEFDKALLKEALFLLNKEDLFSINKENRKLQLK